MKQIYTGYQWRPMTEAELEIMEANRIVDEKTDDAQAGDIYDEPPYSPEDYADAKAQGFDLDDWNNYQRYYDSRNEAPEKCLYCIGDRNASPSLIRERVDVYLHYNTLVVEFPTDNSWGDVDKKINYCPMCGRKLEEAE